MRSYKIYAKASCGYCMRLIKAMVKKKTSFFVQFLDDMPDLLQEKKDFYNHQTVPIVILRENGTEKLIGGCTETLETLKKEK
jgi:glutaredoxin